MTGKNLNAQREALFWRGDEKRPDRVVCLLCPFKCTLPDGKTGICKAKKNIGGRLFAISYGLTTSLAMDPIEKKPLYHFYPGTEILSLGPNSCNLDCSFCQNFQTSQLKAPTRFISPEEVAHVAKSEGSLGVAYTYTEPLMWYEFIIDTAPIVRGAGLKNVLVTNGHLEEEPFIKILPLIDALNIDIKSMDPSFYRKICKGKLEPVLNNVQLAAEAKNVHLEITNLVIPGLNDSEDDFVKLSKFLAELDPFIPLHFSRYRPMYRMNIPPTPVETLFKARTIAEKYLKYVFIGNVHDPDGNTFCPHCRSVVIERDYSATKVSLKEGKCLKCGNDTKIISE